MGRLTFAVCSMGWIHIDPSGKCSPNLNGKQPQNQEEVPGGELAYGPPTPKVRE